jgi:N6-adenosine-specific RNA methylase IME4
MTKSERDRRHYLKKKRENPSPKLIAKRARREAREIQLAGQAKAVEGLYPVICADPPWRYTTRSQNGMDRSADNHYPTMTIEDIAALPIPATPVGFMAMWATVPLLPEALTVMAAWKYTYRSQCLWVKDRIGTGFWFRNQHEILLIGTRGDIPAPSQPWPSVITAPRGAHSEKPAIFYEMIEAYFPNLPRLEMFARGPRAGWSVWGNES